MLLLQRNRSILGTIQNLSICALVQLVLGWPFLSTYPISYIKKAFEFDRVFFYKWTVNWKLISEDLFVSKSWALLLLMFHLGTLAFLAMKWWKASIAQRGPIKTREWMCWTNNSKDHLQTTKSRVYHLHNVCIELCRDSFCTNIALSILLLVFLFFAHVGY